MKDNVIPVLIFFMILVAIFCVFLIDELGTVQRRSTLWIFRTKADYSGNYIGTINYYPNTGTYRSFMAYPFGSVYIKTLNNGYFAMYYPNFENITQRIAIFDDNMPKETSSGLGDSPEMERYEFYKYVIEERPLKELYFCNVPEDDLVMISTRLANNEIDKRCDKIAI